MKLLWRSWKAWRFENIPASGSTEEQHLLFCVRKYVIREIAGQSDARIPEGPFSMGWCKEQIKNAP